MHGHCMQLRFMVDNNGDGNEGSGDWNKERGKKRPDLKTTNKWFIDTCTGRPLPTAFLAERCKFINRYFSTFKDIV